MDLPDPLVPTINTNSPLRISRFMFFSNSPDSIVDVTVRVYELLGAEVFLYLDVDQYEITARVNPRTTARPGDAIKVAFDLAKLHIFDKETEQVITH